MVKIILLSSGNSGLVISLLSITLYDSAFSALFPIVYCLVVCFVRRLFTSVSSCTPGKVDFCMHDCFFILLHGKSYSVFRELLSTVHLLQSSFSCTFFMKVFLPFLTSLSIPFFLFLAYSLFCESCIDYNI